MNPIDAFITAFWLRLRDDLNGDIPAVDDVPYAIRKMPSPIRTQMMRDRIKQEARSFLDTPEFDIWSRVSGFAPAELRHRFKEIACPQ